MKNLREMMLSTRSSFSRAILRFSGRLKTIEDHVAVQNQRLLDLENSNKPSIHSMELKEDDRKDDENSRRLALSDKDLRLDLEVEYGKGKWATRLINEMVAERILVRDISVAFEN